MSALRLPRLPDRNPVKLTITLAPELHRHLSTYADLYREQYGEAESVSELIPFMLRLFLETDKAFVRARTRTPS
jgi:hypothetical protein